MKFFAGVDLFIEKITSWLLILFVVMILLLSTSAIFLRWVHFSQMWIDPLVRHLVFFSSFLGGILATGKGTHIGIDLIGKMLESRNSVKLAKFIELLIAIVSVGTLIWLSVASVDFAKMELQYGKEVFWGIKSGILVSVIPIGFACLAYRSFYIGLSALVTLGKRG